MHHISLFPNKQNPKAYYVRIVAPNNVKFNKTFFFSDRGQQQQALLDAKNYRDQMLFAIWDQDSLTKESYIGASDYRKGKIYRTGRKGTSGTIGVVHQEITRKHGGKSKMWVANWRENGIPKVKSFTYNGEIGQSKYRTSDDAKALAIAHRAKMEKLHYRDC